MRTQRNKRSEERVPAALPVKLGDAFGLTRDVSPSGICFEVDADYATGSEISFEVELEGDVEKMILKCRGSIVRTENREGKISVAVKLIESVLEAAGS